MRGKHMDEALQHPPSRTIGCPRCGGLLWWRSRAGIRVCMVCDPDPLDALHTLRDGGKEPDHIG
jgi:hypothetical protein